MPNDKKIKRSEDSYIYHDILPAFADYNYPQAGDHENLKIKGDIKIRMGSTYKYPDVVFYSDGIPVLLVESKKEGKNRKSAEDQARSYIRNFPIKEYSRDGRPPQYAAITDGRTIYFYKYERDINEYGGIIDHLDSLVRMLTYEELRHWYGLVKKKKPKLSPDIFKDIFYQLISAFDKKDKKKITPVLILMASQLIFEFLKDPNNYVARLPYTLLDGHIDRQRWIRSLLKQHDWNILGEKIAHQFRQEISRSFQGGGLNQYMTEGCIIAFMGSLLGKISPTTKVLDFECGSGEFLAAAIASGIPIKNVMGIDINVLPYTVARTYLSLYFDKPGSKAINSIPVRLGNGLFYYGNNWDLVISNPAGGDRYKHGNENRILKEGLRNLKGNVHVFSEYEFSIQQAIRSARIGGKICLILPEGFFSNLHNEFLRKYVAKYCKVLAIISLPRGVFKIGTSVKSRGGGSHIATMKMSILFAEKIKEIKKNEGLNINSSKLNYPIFLANINKPDGAGENICDWLKPELSLILKQWNEWQKSHHYRRTIKNKFYKVVNAKD